MRIVNVNFSTQSGTYFYREYNPDSAGTRRDELSSGRLTRLVLDRW